MTLTAYTLTSATTAYLQQLVQDFRYKDDDEEDDVQEFISAFVTDWLLIGKIPYFKEAVSLYQGYSASGTETLWLESAFKAYDFWNQVIDGEEKNQWKLVKTTREEAMKKAIDETLKAASYFSGIAAYNQWRDLRALLRTLGVLD